MHSGPGQPVPLVQSGASCGAAVKPQAAKNRLARRAACPIVAPGSERAARGNKQRPMASPDIFLSYNREDAAAAKRFADAFAAEGLNVWWDTALRSGEAYDEVTEAALRAAKAVVVLWSPRSVVSRWVRAVTEGRGEELEQRTGLI